MASDGLLNMAKHGKCRICQRVRNTKDQVKAVGEVKHGFATGHVWECIDTEGCDKSAELKLNRYTPGSTKHRRISLAIEQGRFKEYLTFV